MQYNIAVAKTIRGQFDEASTILKQVWQQRSKTYRVPAHIVMLFIYIELQLGKNKFKLIFCCTLEQTNYTACQKFLVIKTIYVVLSFLITNYHFAGHTEVAKNLIRQYPYQSRLTG